MAPCRPLRSSIVSDLQHRLQTDVPPDFFVPLIRRGELGDAAAATGAGLLPLHASFSPDLAALAKAPSAKCSPLSYAFHFSADRTKYRLYILTSKKARNNSKN
jgi:hypothetical protein